MTMAAEIKKRMGPGATAGGGEKANMKLTPGTSVKTSSGGCCWEMTPRRPPPPLPRALSLCRPVERAPPPPHLQTPPTTQFDRTGQGITWIPHLREEHDEVGRICTVHSIAALPKTNKASFSSSCPVYRYSADRRSFNPAPLPLPAVPPPSQTSQRLLFYLALWMQVRECVCERESFCFSAFQQVNESASLRFLSFFRFLFSFQWFTLRFVLACVCQTVPIWTCVFFMFYSSTTSAQQCLTVSHLKCNRRVCVICVCIYICVYMYTHMYAHGLPAL